MDGILLVDKPSGVSSAGVIRELKRRLALGRSVRVGHLGTLDPFATGLLPIALGEGTKAVPFLNQEGKSYEGAIRLGIATDTLDPTGQETERAPVPAFDEAMLAGLAARFTGEISQVPPMYSALKRDGERLYALARKGIEVEREPRHVVIHSFTLAKRDDERLAFAITCSKGTYIRSLALDVARALSTVGHLESLRRTSFGRFEIGAASTLEAIGLDQPPRIVSVREALGDLREIVVPDGAEGRIRAGQQFVLGGLPPPATVGEHAKIVNEAGVLVAVLGAPDGRRWRIVRVFVPPPAVAELGFTRR